MRIALGDGVLIEGSEEELRDLIDDIEQALDGTPSEGVMLTDDAVVQFVVRLAPE